MMQLTSPSGIKKSFCLQDKNQELLPINKRFNYKLYKLIYAFRLHISCEINYKA